MVAAAALAIVVFAVLMSHAIALAITEREPRIEEKTRVLAQVGKLAEGYRRAQAERQALEARLKGPPVPLMSHVSQAGPALGIEVSDLRPTGAPAELEGMSEEPRGQPPPHRAREARAASSRRWSAGPGVVKVRRLRLATRSDDPKLVDATLVVSTYQLKG